ncbi:ribose-phosphate pyrophosphokinase [Raphidocelis subcapitata]|uniref:ribose-phosphate diphosphokinase n=1 Tax=Raphidocelis subcapitata TaxID=307507 RepID=A0A2V0PDW4_9CHLO|nr:ribose-phosphate pyrophosphokinase [Raphidocelis subcapitata]|eukprot:GBF98048.1 ribose-phosphate pyrophosphokinase [Raphidocelis subcapitata]
MRVFSGSSNVALAGEVAAYLGTQLGAVTVKRFADGETYVRYGESVRGCDVYLIQPTAPPVNESFMELALLIDAARRASARSITAVIPYYGYARGNSKARGREAISAKLAANLLTRAGVDRLVTLDLHAGAIAGFFDVPVDHAHAAAVALPYLASKAIPRGELVVVSPDIGGVSRARAFAARLNDASLAIVDERHGPRGGGDAALIGDVAGRVAVVVDDMIDSGVTVCRAAEVLRAHGARSVLAFATHALLTPPTVERLRAAALDEVIVSNSIAVPAERTFPGLTVLSVASLLGESIYRIHRSN